jgi:hypothetical protein
MKKSDKISYLLFLNNFKVFNEKTAFLWQKVTCFVTDSAFVTVSSLSLNPYIIITYACKSDGVTKKGLKLVNFKSW